LNATSSIPGTFTYTPAVGAVLLAGVQTLSVSFSPTAATDFAYGTSTVSITVNKAQLAIAANNATRAYGTANPTFSGTVTGAQSGDTFSENFTSSAAIASPAGSYSIVPSVTRTNLSDYAQSITNGTLTVSHAGTTTSLNVSATSIAPGATCARAGRH
jgi:MBG domain (YGX type)